MAYTFVTNRYSCQCKAILSLRQVQTVDAKENPSAYSKHQNLQRKAWSVFQKIYIKSKSFIALTVPFLYDTGIIQLYTDKKKNISKLKAS